MRRIPLTTLVLALGLAAAPAAAQQADSSRRDHKPLTFESAGGAIADESKRVGKRGEKAAKKAAKQTERQARRTGRWIERTFSRKARREQAAGRSGPPR
jgi:hypothetical protein